MSQVPAKVCQGKFRASAASFGWRNPPYDMHLALLADEAHEKSNRDKTLDRVKREAPRYRPAGSRQNYASFAALAGLMIDDPARQGKGEIDLTAAERPFLPQPFLDEGNCAETDSPVVSRKYSVFNYVHQGPTVTDLTGGKVIVGGIVGVVIPNT